MVLCTFCWLVREDGGLRWIERNTVREWKAVRD